MGKEERKPNVLIVDDERGLREPLAQFLESKKYGYKITTAGSYNSTLECCMNEEFDVVLLDNMLPRSENQSLEILGIELMTAAREILPSAEFIFFTGWGMDDGLEALNAGAYRYMAKPFNHDELAITIRMAAEHAIMRRDRRNYSKVLEIGREAVGKRGIEESVRAIIDTAEEISDFDICSVALKDSASTQLRIITSSSVDRSQIRWTRHIDDELTLQIIKTEQPFEESYVMTASNVAPQLIEAGIGSFAGYPIGKNGSCYGVVYVYSNKAKPLTIAARQSLELLSELIHSILENVRLFEQARQENGRIVQLNQQLIALQEVAVQIEESLPLPQLLDEISRIATELLGADSGNVLMCDNGYQYLTIDGGYRISQRMRDSTWELIGKNIAGQTVATKTAILAHDIPNNPDFNNPVADDELLAILSMPLWVEDRVIGTLDVHSKTDPYAFGEEEQRILSLLANQAASAISNSQYRERMDSSIKTIRALSTGSQAISSKQSVQDVLDTVVKEARNALDAMRVKIVLYHRHELTDIATAGFEGSNDTAEKIRSSGGITWNVMKSMLPWYSSDILKEKEGKVNSILIQEQVRAAACIPIVLPDEQSRGAMWFHFPEERHFEEIEKEWLAFFGSQVAIGFDRSQRIHELERLHSAADSLAKCVTLEDVINTIVDTSCQVMMADSAVFWPYDGGRNKFITRDVKATENISDIWTKGFSQVIEPSPHGTAIRIMDIDTLPVVDVSSSDSEIEPNSKTATILKEIGAQSFLGLALKTETERLGILYINFNSRTVFTQRIIQLAETFADQAALAYRKARLQNQVRESHRVAGVVANLTTLEASMNDTLESVVNGTQNVLNCDAITLYVYQSDRKQLIYPPIMLGVKQPGEVTLMDRVPEGSLPFLMMDKDEPYIIEDIEHDDLFSKAKFPKREGVHSCIAIPLSVGLEKVGVMFVNYHITKRFISDEIDDLALFANQAAIVIHNAQLHEQRKRRIQALESLNEAKNAIAGASYTNAFFSVIAEQVWQVVSTGKAEAYHSSIRKVQAQKAELLSTYPVHIFDHSLSNGRKDLPIGIDGDYLSIIDRAVRTRISQRIGDVAKDSDYYRVNESTRSQLTIPIELEGQVYGVINVEHEEVNAFDEQDQKFLESLAFVTALAMQNMSKIRELDNHARYQSAIYAASKEISTDIIGDRLRLLNRILTEAVRMVQPLNGQGSDNKVVFGLIQEFNEERNTLILRTTYPLNSDTRYSWRPDEGRELSPRKGKLGISGRAVIEMKTQRVDDVSNDSDYFSRGKKHKSELSVPLRDGDKILGVLTLESDQMYAFSNADQKAVESLAELAVIAIQNSESFQELQDAKGMVGARTALAWMGMVSSQWRHEIGNHAISLRDRTNLLKKDIQKGESANKLIKHLDEIQRVALEVKNTPFTAPLSASDGVSIFELNRLVDRRLNRLLQEPRFKHISFPKSNRQLKDYVLNVSASSQWLQHVLDILISNAAKAMVNSAKKEIFVSTRLENNKAFVYIRDTGCGIPDEKLPSLFQATGDSREGHGVGLLIAQMILETYDGGIQVAKTNPEGTTMELWLPLV